MKTLSTYLKSFPGLRSITIFYAFTFFSCSPAEIPENKNGLFEFVSANYSGIHFANTITTSDSVNILSYEYLYNGGGVGIGDFNNDSLPDLFFTGNMVPSKLYLNRGDFRFEDITEQSLINTTGDFAFGVSIIDINQDGWNDIFVCVGGMGNKNTFPNRLFINQGDLTFKEMAHEYGLDDTGESVQAAFFDYDKDGDLDMYLLTGGGFEKPAITLRPISKNGSARNTDRLYRNDYDSIQSHPYYINVSNESGILEEGFGLGVSIVDVNNDHWPDVYVTNDYSSSDLLYINNRNGSFSEKASEFFKHTSHFAMGNTAGDINNDALVDIVAVDMLPEQHSRRKLMFGPHQYDRFYASIAMGYGYQYMRNTLQLNRGNGQFSEIGQYAGIDKTDWSWAVLLADFDNDTYQDLYITNGYRKDVTDLDFVKFRRDLSNEPDVLKRKSAFKDSLEARPGIKVSNYAYHNNGDNTFSKISTEWGLEVPSYSNGCAYADLDNDGDLDLVVNNIDAKAFVFKNRLKEKNISSSNYLDIKLIGSERNKSGIGSKIEIRYNGKVQVRFQHPVQGFQSSVEDEIHFGLGNHTFIDTLTVTWFDGKVSSIYGLKANQNILVTYDSSQKLKDVLSERSNKLFESIASEKIPFIHRENEFNDFNYQPLLQHKFSQQGPGVAVGDVNGDGLEDVYFGGAYRQPRSIFIQQKNNVFKAVKFGSLENEPGEDTGSLFFDADNDSDLDLYVVTGGSEYSIDHAHYLDHLYKNDGKGNFVEDKRALPPIASSGSVVIASDFDHDGDLDLFVGGRVVPGRFPESPASHLFRNDGNRFSDVTVELAPGLRNIGMVTSALWSDYNNDHWSDLILVGEGMPITIFTNHSGKLVADKMSGLSDSEGFWNSIISGDFDNDGDTDYIAGNMGTNTPYKASVEKPVNIFYADFDNNGSIDPITSYYEEKESYPIAALDALTQQIPSLKKHIHFYRNFAGMSSKQLLALNAKSSYETLSCKTLSTSYIENIGNKKFTITPLPMEMQLAPVNGLLADDINLDGNLDVIAVGNSYSYEVVSGRYDASKGVVLFGDGKDNFVSPSESGLLVDGDAKGLSKIEVGNETWIVATQNNESLKIFSLCKNKNLKIIKAKSNEAFAIIAFNDQQEKQRIELSYGGSYLSQSSRSVTISPLVTEIAFYDFKGDQTRLLHF